MRIYANPYAYGASGFYFDTAEEWDEKFAKAERKGVEEFELEFIDGTDLEAALFDAIRVNQANVHEWFEFVPEVDYEKVRMIGALYVAQHLGERDMAEILKQLDDLTIYEGDVETALQNMAEETSGSIEDWLEDMRKAGRRADLDVNYYFDYDQFGHDVQFDFDEEEHEQYEGMDDNEIGEEYIDSVYGSAEDIPAELLAKYFDWEKYARDVQINGGVAEFELGHKYYTVFG